MSPLLVELCSFLIREFYGNLPAVVFTTIARNERLSHSGLLQLLHTKRIAPTTSTQALAVLFQYNLIYYFEESFSVNIDAAYSLVRLGKSLKAVELRFGQECCRQLSNVFCSGMVTEQELEDFSVLGPIDQDTQKHNVKSLVNGDHTDHSDNAAPSVSGLNGISGAVEAMKKLQAQKYLEDVNDYTFLSVTDLNKVFARRVEAENPALRGSITAPAKRKEKRRLVAQKRKRLVNSGESLFSDDEFDEAESPPPYKKQKLDAMSQSEQAAKDEHTLAHKKNMPNGASSPLRGRVEEEEDDDDDDDSNESSASPTREPSHQTTTTATGRGKGASQPSTNSIKSRGIQQGKRKRSSRNHVVVVDSSDEEAITGDSNEQSNEPAAISASHEGENGDSNPRKKRKMNDFAKARELNGATDGAKEGGAGNVGGETVSLRRQAVSRVNQAKLLVALRSERLADWASETLQSTCASVYRAALQHLETDINCCVDIYAADDQLGDDTDDEDTIKKPHITTADVVDLLDEATVADIRHEQRAFEATHHERDSAHDKSKPSIEITIDEPPNGKRKGRPPINGKLTAKTPAKKLTRSELHNYVDEYLHMLASDPHEFITHEPELGQDVWTVDFYRLADTLAQEEIEKLISYSFGQLASRMVRILDEMGRLDEKSVATLAMCKLRDVRETLAALQAANIVDMQEVPRDATRTVTRSIFLWFYDQDRVRAMLLEDTYRAMGRCLQRREAERKKVRFVLDKAERSDVRGREDKFLNERELEVLRGYEQRADKLMVEVGRLDDIVMTLRDFLPRYNEQEV